MIANDRARRRRLPLPRAIARAVAMLVAIGATPSAAFAQAGAGSSGRVSFYVDSAARQPTDALGGAATRTTDVWTAATFESADSASSGVDFRFDGRASRTVQGSRPPRVSIYDGYVGARIGSSRQLRVRAGHMWLQDIGTVGALAGALVEFGQPRQAEGTRLRVGAFGGLEPTLYDVGYSTNVRKIGGYAAIESGFLRRHVVGYTRVTQGALLERSVVTTTNLVPVGRRFFAYQAAEFEVNGPAQGLAARGLSYLLANIRFNPAERLELTATYNKGRSIDARTLTSDLLNGRVLSPQAIDGLKYESRGGRISLEVTRGLRVYAGYTQDRNNRSDALTGRVTVGAYAGNVGRSGFDVSASSSRVDRSSGRYQSTYVSIGHGLGRTVYLSADFTTSLSVVQFMRGDGLLIETRPWSKRYSGSANANLNRHMSLSFTGEVTNDASQREVRVLSGLSYRF